MSGLRECYFCGRHAGMTHTRSKSYYVDGEFGRIKLTKNINVPICSEACVDYYSSKKIIVDQNAIRE